MVNKPTRGIGDTSMASLAKAADAHGCSLYEAAFFDDLESYGLKNAAVQKIRAFCSMIKAYADQVSTTPAMDIARGILDDSGLYMYYKTEAKSEGAERLQNVEEVLNAVASKQEALIEEAEKEENEVEGKPVLYLSEFLEDIALLSSIDNEEKDKETVTTVENKVKLMTIHTAKGLEFAHVFVPGMEENIFPSGGWLLKPSDLEEERRLFYVAMTRAKKTLTLMYATERFRNGKTEYNSPSRFLRELAPQYLDKPLLREDFESRSSDFEDDAPRGYQGGFRWQRPAPQRPVEPERPRPRTVSEIKAELAARPKPPVTEDFVPDPMSSFRVGDSIEHNRFGAGKVLEITGNVPDLKARISFEKYGEKLLLLKFAKLRHK